MPHPNGEPDDYFMPGVAYVGYFPLIPDFQNRTWPWLCNCSIYNPKDLVSASPVGCDTYLINLEYAPYDGVW